MAYNSTIKNNEILLGDNRNGPSEYYPKWNKSEKDRYCIISHGESQKQTKEQTMQNRNWFIDTEIKHLVALGEGLGELGEGDQEVQTYS